MLCDVVMLSNTKEKRFRVMTQHAIDTCLASEAPGTFNMIIVEQQRDVKYPGTMTIHVSTEFNLSRFANEGAKLGTAPWVCIANNDLVFEKGWFTELMKTGYPVVSPKCPGDGRQQYTQNTTGWDSGGHLSNWCFVMKRVLWEELGGFDEDFKFWHSIDSLLMKLKKKGIPPMHVVNSRVRHLGSQTLMTEGKNLRELTINQSMKWRKKHG